MVLKSLLILVLSLGVSTIAAAEPDLSGSWVRVTSPGKPGWNRWARNTPVTVAIKQHAGKVQITAIQDDGVKSVYDCAMTSPCTVTVNDKINTTDGWWVRWDGAELVLELRSDARSPAQELWRFRLSSDQSLMFRQPPQTQELDYRKQ